MAIYYVDPAAGSDVAAGTAFGTAWATTQKALDTVAAGDEVRLCKSATETISAVIDLDTTTGTAADKITLISYAADGSAPSDGYTITTSSSIGAIVDHAPGSFNYYRWIGVTFDANDSADFCYLNTTSDGSGLTFFLRCVLKDPIYDCLAVRGNSWHLHGCEITGAGRHGIAQTAANRGGTSLFDCKIHHNTNNGVDANVGVGVTRCLIYRNGGYGGDAGSNSTNSGWRQNTFYGNTNGGLSLYDAANRNQFTVAGNTFVANGGYGYNQKTTALNPMIQMYNHHYVNTSGGAYPSNADLGADLITGDPLFTSTTDGSEDFTPAAGSPLVGAGIAGQDIGARSAAPGGGAAPIISVF